MINPVIKLLVLKLLQRPIAFAGIVVLAAIGCAEAARGSDARPELSASSEAATLPMMSDPPLEHPAPKVQFDRRNIALWLLALQRPEFDVRVDAVMAFVAAHRQGVRDLGEAMNPIVNILATDPHIQVRLAAARALVEFDYRPAADALLRAVMPESEPSTELVLVVDPALARWRHTPAVPMWMNRLQHAAARPAACMSALRSLAGIGATESGSAVRACVQDRALSSAVRLEAAKAAAIVERTGRAELANELAGQPAPLGSILALFALGAGTADISSGTSEPSAVALLESLLRSPDARVRSHAMRLLRRTDPALALAHIDALRDPDDQVRLEATLVRVGVAPSDHAIVELSRALNDPSEPVRVAARAGLRAMWKQRATQVQPMIELALSGGNWRESEQAAILVGELGIAELAERLETMLVTPRPEVRLAAVTTLRILNVEHSIHALIARATVLAAAASESAKDPARFESEGRELVQIFQLLALRRHAPASDLLRKFIPKHSGQHPVARGAAIYALGKIFENQPIPDLVLRLTERAEDNSPVDAEAAEVRRFAAISLARMGARQSLAALRGVYETENSTVSSGGAARWAIMQLESIDLPPCDAVVVKVGPFFLESISPLPDPAQR